MQTFLRRPLQQVVAKPSNLRMGSSKVGGGYTWASKIPLAKIIATIGPASEQAPMLQSVTDAGMRIMRINFSHATYDEAELRLTNLRKVSKYSLYVLKLISYRKVV